MSSTSTNDVNMSYKVHKIVEAGRFESVPDHWQVLSLRYVTRFAYGDALASDIREAGNFSVYGSNGAVGTHIRPNTESPALIIGRKGSFGKINYSDQAVFAIDTTYFVDARQTIANLRWLFYALQCLGLDKISQDTGVPGLSREDAYSRYVALPPLPEQQAIAAFLDRETARIDVLIARKERLLELLEEKRKAIISQAVTRGLDASVPMKDSGVEWLGQIPEGWAVQRLKNLSRFVTSGSRGWAEFYADSGSTFIRIGNLQRRSIDPDLSDIQYVNVPAGSEGERTRIQDGDVLISITADLGSVAAAGVNLQGAYVSQHVALVRLQSGVNPRWLAYAVMGDTAKSHFKMGSYGGTKIQLSLEDVRETPVFVPPYLEQQAIAAYLDAQTAKLDALRQKMKQSVEKLSEYRTSLISAAVTGKIDVRGEVPDY